MKIYDTVIFSLGDERYKLRWPLLVNIEERDDETIATIPEFDLYASAVSPSLVLSSLKAEIVSTYERLTDLGPEKLGGFMLQCFEAMRTVIQETASG